MKAVICFYFCTFLLATHRVHAGRDGATSTSCYTHVITHLRFGNPEDILKCEGSNDKCKILSLTPMCSEDQDEYEGCCTGLGNKTLYTKCNYTFQWNVATNLGYLVQARVIEGEQTATFDSSTTIIGTWYDGVAHKPLWCNSSSSATDEEPVPNSVTHSGIFTEDNLNAPPNINLTWSANTTIISPDQQEERSVNITFFYTIARDISTNFFPYTRDNLYFTLSPHPSVLPPTIPPPTTPPPTTPPPTTPPPPPTMPIVGNAGITTNEAARKLTTFGKAAIIGLALLLLLIQTIKIPLCV